MFQRGRLSHWCLSLFVYFLVYPFTVPLVLYRAQAQTVPSKSETQDALEKISTFLQNESGARWLAELAQGQQKAALTTDELMEAVLGVTKENSTVWQAAATLRSALAAQADREKIPSTNLTTASSEPVKDYWSDVITDLEKHDDIICLYRKDTEAKMKKSSDWQKLLKNVSPGYTVHLALDRGSKYVICLKKVNVPTSQTTETDPPTTLISSAEDISSTIPTSTHVTQISRRDEDSVTTVETTAQPSVSITTTNFPTTKTTRNLIQEITETPATIQQNSSSLEAENDRRNDNTYKDDSVKNSEDEISKSSETNYETACREPRDNSEPETPEWPPPVIVTLTTAQVVGNCEESEDDMAASCEHDSSEEYDSQEMVESPRLIGMPHDLRSQSSAAGEIRSSVIDPCLTNPIFRMPYIAQPCPQQSIPDPYQFSQSIARDLNTQIPTASVNAPFLNHFINIPTRLNSAEPSEWEIEPCNSDSEYPSQISSEQLLPVENNFQRESWLPKLSSEKRDSANRVPLTHPPIMPPCQIGSDCLKVLFPKFGIQEVRKPLISEARVTSQHAHPIISIHGSSSDAPSSSNPSFLSPSEENRQAPSPVEYLGARENPFGFSLKPIKLPFYQTGYFPQSLMERNSRFQKNLDPVIEPIGQNPAFSKAPGIPRFEPCLQNPSIPKYQKNLHAGNSPTFLPFNEQIIPSAFASPGIPSNIFPNGNPSMQRNSLPQMPRRDQNWDRLASVPHYSSSSSGLRPNFDLKMMIEKKLLMQGVGKDRVASGSYVSNYLSPIPRVQYPHAPHNTRSSPTSKIPIGNGGYTFGDIHSSVAENRVPESLNLANEDSIKRNAPLIDHSTASAGQGIDKPIRNEAGNALNFSDYIRTILPVSVPNNLSNARKIPGREKLNVANSHASHDRTCPNSCRGPIPLEIKIHGSTADSIGINVIPGKGEKVKIIDAKKGLFSVERKEGSRLFEQDFNSRKHLFKESWKKLAKDDDAESLETRVDETADEFEKHLHRKNFNEEKNLPAITDASSLTDRDMKSLGKSSSTMKETAKLDNIPPIIDAQKNTASVNDTSTESHNSTKNSNP